MRLIYTACICLLIVVGNFRKLYAQQKAEPAFQTLTRISIPTETIKLKPNQPYEHRVYLHTGEVANLRVHTRIPLKLGNVLKKVTPFIGAGMAQLSQEKNGQIDNSSPRLGNNQLTAGATIGIGTFTSISGQHNIKTFATIALYDKMGQLLSSRRKWLRQKDELVRLSTGLQDGFAVITFVSPVEQSIVIGDNRQNSRTVDQLKGESTKGGRLGVADGPANGPITANGPYEAGDEPAGGNCTDWWLVTYERETGTIVDEQYVGRSCDGSNQGGGINDTEKNCKECKAMHTKERNAQMTLAKERMVKRLSVGCHLIAGGTFVTLNVVSSWLHVLPGVGTATVEAISALGALVVDIDCLVDTALEYNAQKATIDAKYYDDMNGCGGCPY
ncbi:hypothetical protein [Spirosoma validum]|uniref:Uncharacterized protein n=1 Tax=Spirosoma validum TaxID=2771355 RepID=A0A927BA17_9BACT|nr:hypothetical protein [Spirosoma validum]MBD2757872.1 hypothetical protein [Spirosoma validum]